MWTLWKIGHSCRNTKIYSVNCRCHYFSKCPLNRKCFWLWVCLLHETVLFSYRSHRRSCHLQIKIKLFITKALEVDNHLLGASLNGTSTLTVNDLYTCRLLLTMADPGFSKANLVGGAPTANAVVNFSENLCVKMKNSGRLGVCVWCCYFDFVILFYVFLFGGTVVNRYYLRLWTIQALWWIQ